jgi:hypothetical protein
MGYDKRRYSFFCLNKSKKPFPTSANIIAHDIIALPAFSGVVAK